MFAHHRRKIQVLFAVADAVLTALAFEAAYLVRTAVPGLGTLFFLQPRAHILLLAFCAALGALLGSWGQSSAYLHSARLSHLVAHTVRLAATGTILIILLQYLLRLDPPLSRSFICLFFVFDLCLLAFFRRLAPTAIAAFQRGFGSVYHVVLVGQPAKSARLARTLLDSSPFRIQVAACLTEAECALELSNMLSQQIVDEVIFAIDSSNLPALEDVFLACDEEGVRTRVAVDFFPHVNSDVTLDRVGDASLLTFSAAPLDDTRLLLKRFFDVAVSSVALVTLSPLFLFIALLVKFSSPGPVLFRQHRCGLNGRRFTMYKFRSMVQNAQELRPQIEHLNERQVAFKIARDPRITSVGRWLRKFSLDELPQLYNVLGGDMSIVGPRPPVPEEVDRYERWQRRRLRMRPGLTCLWAVSGRDLIDFNAWMRMDIKYIENWSLKLDWSIILRTIPHVLAGKGAH